MVLRREGQSQRAIFLPPRSLLVLEGGCPPACLPVCVASCLPMRSNACSLELSLPRTRHPCLTMSSTVDSQSGHLPCMA